MEQELIEFEFAGMQLQEPMAVVTNWIMAAFCWYAYLKLRPATSMDVVWWRRFFLFFTITAFFGGTGHLFFKYLGVWGKYPNWILGIVSGYCAGKAILVHLSDSAYKRFLELFLPLKGLVLLALALILQKFIFVAVDAIVTYVLYCGLVAYQQYKKGVKNMKYMVIGVLICLPLFLS